MIVTIANNDPLNDEFQEKPIASSADDVASQPSSEDSSYKLPLQKIIDSAHVPAVSYGCVLPNEDKTKFTPTSLAVGKKDATSTESDNSVDENTRFPASSLSKIVFTYLVLQLAKEPKPQINLDMPLYDILGSKKFEYERFREQDGHYPEKATQITARDVLSHTTGLPNVEPTSPTPVKFKEGLERGEDYSYSGEAILYLQKAIEAKTGKDLETLAKEYVFDPLHMEHSTFLPQPNGDTKIVKVHSEQGVPTVINEGNSQLNVANAAGSLLTTADDFSKLMVAWLKDMDDPKDSITRQAFKPTNAEASMTPGKRTCGLGWHIHKNKKDEVIAYQYGENLNTRSFVALNVNDKKGAVFFTNSINGSSIANQVLNSSDLPPIGDLQDVYKDLNYRQSDVPGSEEAKAATIAGKIAEQANQFDEARRCFKEALKFTPNDVSQKNRLDWFNERHLPNPKEPTFTEPLETFIGEYTNEHGDHVEISPTEGGLMYKQYNHDTKLVRISETDFLPEKDQSFKVRIVGDKMSKFTIDGNEYKLPKSMLELNSTQDTVESDVPTNVTTTSTETTESPQVSGAQNSMLVPMNPSAKQLEERRQKIKQFKDQVPHDDKAPSADNTEKPTTDDDSSYTW